MLTFWWIVQAKEKGRRSLVSSGSPHSCANASLYPRKILKPLTPLFNLLSPNPAPPTTTITNAPSPLTLPLAAAAADAYPHRSLLFNSHLLSLSHLLQVPHLYMNEWNILNYYYIDYFTFNNCLSVLSTVPAFCWHPVYMKTILYLSLCKIKLWINFYK